MSIENNFIAMHNTSKSIFGPLWSEWLFVFTIVVPLYVIRMSYYITYPLLLFCVLHLMINNIFKLYNVEQVLEENEVDFFLSNKIE
jgi:hypothetical protein